MSEVFYFISAGFFAISLWMVMRYNLHMFQLNRYKNKEHRKWLLKNARNQLILTPMLIAGVCVAVWNIIPLAVVLYIVYAGIIGYYFYLFKSNTKKKLIF